MKKKWVISGSVIASLMLLAWLMNQQSEPVTAIQLHRQNAIATLTVTGEVQGDITVDFSPPVTAKITQITVDEGDFVEPGQLLVQLDNNQTVAQWQQAEAQVKQSQEAYLNLKQGTRPEQIALQQQRLAEENRHVEEAESALKTAQAQALDASRNAKRYQELFKQELVSTQEYDTVQLQENTSRQKVEQSKATLAAVKHQRAQALSQLNEAQNGPTKPELAEAYAGYIAAKDNAKAARSQITQYSLHSNFKGLVVDRLKDPGDLGRPGESILKIINPQTLEILCSVEENDLNKIRLNDTAYVVLDAFPEIALKARIRRIGRQINPDNGTVEAHVVLLPSEWAKLKGIGLLPGMTADVSVIIQRLQQALVVPASAVKKENGRWYVFIFQDHRLVKQPVQGERLSIENFRITSGLKEGQWVAVLANDTLLNKKKVHPAQAPGTAQPKTEP